MSSPASEELPSGVIKAEHRRGAARLEQRRNLALLHHRVLRWLASLLRRHRETSAEERIYVSADRLQKAL